MIKPPFTILVLKQSHHPVTIRVTTLLISIVLFIFLLITGISGFTLYYFSLKENLFKKSGSIVSTANNSIEFTPDKLMESSRSGEAQSKPGIAEMTVSRLKKTGLRFTFRITTVSLSDLMYIWLIINPEADTIADRVIYPRSAVFRGLPVNYKNGIVYHPMEQQEISIMPGSDIVDADVKRFRVLVYRSDGTLIIDKQYIRTRSGLKEG